MFTCMPLKLFSARFTSRQEHENAIHQDVRKQTNSRRNHDPIILSNLTRGLILHLCPLGIPLTFVIALRYDLCPFTGSLAPHNSSTRYRCVRFTRFLSITAAEIRTVNCLLSRLFVCGYDELEIEQAQNGSIELCSSTDFAVKIWVV